jgi:GNAT superfamily N-acetyltransferase
MSDAAVRPARAEDARDLFQAWQALRQYYASVDPRIVPAPVSFEEFRDDFLRRLARNDVAAFVATGSDGLAGFITGGIEPNQPDRLPELHATVGHLFVLPAFRRQGIARKLFDELSSWAAGQEGVSHFEMPVLARDPDAVHFWEAVGFAPFIQRLWAPLSAGPADR